MPLLLLLPMLVLAILGLWAVLLPISLIQRYRFGRKRRRVVAWANSANAWLMLILVAAFFLSGWMATRWLPDAFVMAAMGFAVGIALGILNLLISHREVEAGSVFITPNAVLVLGMTLLVASRILLGFWQLYEHGFQLHPIQREEAWFLRPDSLFALGGLLLGHYFAWCWGLRSMLRRLLPR